MIDRTLLPQIKSDQIDEFCAFASKMGVDNKIMKCKAKDISPIQKKLNKKKIKNLLDGEISNAPLLVDKDGNLMDGHHRWAARLIKDADQPVFCIRFDCDMKRLFKIGHMFDGSSVKTMKETLFIE